MNRRDFLISSCKACVATGGGLLLTSLFSSCSSLQVYKTAPSTNVIEVPKSAFAPDERKKIIRAAGIGYDILLLQPPGSEPWAILMRCSHQDSALVALNKGFTCSMHGSQFEDSGEVISGPATAPLKKFKVSQNETSYLIQLS